MRFLFLSFLIMFIFCNRSILTQRVFMVLNNENPDMCETQIGIV